LGADGLERLCPNRRNGQCRRAASRSVRGRHANEWSGGTGGTTNKFIVRAWGGGYATYEQAATNVGVLIGQSTQVTLVTGGPGGAAPTPPASLLAAGLSGFTLTSNNPIAVLTVNCASNKTVECGAAWAFDAPAGSTTCAQYQCDRGRHRHSYQHSRSLRQHF